MATKDIWIFSATEELEGELLLQTGDDLKSVTGIEKLVNIFTHIFFTEVGSDLIYSDTGTQFSEVIGGNLFFNEGTANGFLTLAVVETFEIISDDQQEIELSSTLPDDEFLKESNLLDFSILSDTVNLSVELISRSGAKRVIRIPLKHEV